MSSDSLKGKGFTQVARTAATADSADPLDPLSMFALEGEKQDRIKEEDEEAKKAIDAKSTNFVNTAAGPALVVSRPPSVGSYFKDDSPAESLPLSAPNTRALKPPQPISAPAVGVSPLTSGQSVQQSTVRNSSTGTGSGSPLSRPPSNQQLPHAANRNSDTISTHSPRNSSRDLRSRTNSPATTELSPEADDGDENMIRLLTGEQKIMNILDSFVTIPSGETISGILFMTNYRLAFVPSAVDLNTIAMTNPAIHSWLQVPLAAIDRIDRDRKSKETGSSTASLVISCKDFRQLRITIRHNHSSANSSVSRTQQYGNQFGHSSSSYNNLSNSHHTADYDIEKAINVMAAYVFPNNMRYLFAFSHKFRALGLDYTPVPYEAAVEYTRMGVLDNNYWRVTGANAAYKLCNTYPQWLVVPSSITDEELHLSAGFRSGHRLPVMCWADRESGLSMWRSSQPKAGVSGTCVQDEKLLELIARSIHYSYKTIGSGGASTGLTKKRSNSMLEPVLYIVDCRSRTSAMANRAAGAGYESQTNYPHSRLDFYGIGNIHAVRDAYKALAAILIGPPGHSNVGTDLNFSKHVEDTQWLSNIRAILKAAHDTATYIRSGFPVLVHCTHGWDRTAQVCSLAQLLLDPYYRTFEGFQVLVEKEWMALGHPFQLRCAHAQDKSTRVDDQMAPVFIQFLDCVWQVQHQFPQYFHFNARFLLTLSDHFYSGRFSTFLFSSDHDRDLYNTRHMCADLWTYLHHNRGSFINPLYSDGQGTLLPSLSLLLRNVTLWTDYFFRWSSVPSLPVLPIQLSQHLYFDGISQPLRKEEEEINEQDQVVTGDIDFELTASVTSQDFWESAYRMERVKRINFDLNQQKLIEDQQKIIANLCNLLREKNPDLKEDELLSASMNISSGNPNNTSHGADDVTKLLINGEKEEPNGSSAAALASGSHASNSPPAAIGSTGSKPKARIGIADREDSTSALQDSVDQDGNLPSQPQQQQQMTAVEQDLLGGQDGDRTSSGAVTVTEDDEKRQEGATSVVHGQLLEKYQDLFLSPAPPPKQPATLPSAASFTSSVSTSSTVTSAEIPPASRPISPNDDNNNNNNASRTSSPATTPVLLDKRAAKLSRMPSCGISGGNHLGTSSSAKSLKRRATMDASTSSISMTGEATAASSIPEQQGEEEGGDRESDHDSDDDEDEDDRLSMADVEDLYEYNPLK